MENTKFKKFIDSLFVVGERTTGSDYEILTNASSIEELDILFFFDSRSKNSDSNISLNSLIFDHFQDLETRYLLVSRPYGSTTFFSLVNFLREIDVKFKYLYTNMGFVDFTPKKKEIIQDIMTQGETAFPDLEFKSIFCERFELSSGEVVDLETLDVSVAVQSISDSINDYVESQFCLVGTPEIPKKVKFERKRPESFPEQLRATNIFLNQLYEASKDKCRYIPLSFQEENYDLSLDGVHFKEDFHKIIFKHLKPLLSEK